MFDIPKQIKLFSIIVSLVAIISIICAYCIITNNYNFLEDLLKE